MRRAPAPHLVPPRPPRPPRRRPPPNRPPRRSPVPRPVVPRWATRRRAPARRAPARRRPGRGLRARCGGRPRTDDSATDPESHPWPVDVVPRPAGAGYFFEVALPVLSPPLPDDAGVSEPADDPGPTVVATVSATLSAVSANRLSTASPSRLASRLTTSVTCRTRGLSRTRWRASSSCWRRSSLALAATTQPAAKPMIAPSLNPMARGYPHGPNLNQLPHWPGCPG